MYYIEMKCCIAFALDIFHNDIIVLPGLCMQRIFGHLIAITTAPFIDDLLSIDRNSEHIISAYLNQKLFGLMHL